MASGKILPRAAGRRSYTDTFFPTKATNGLNHAAGYSNGCCNAYMNSRRAQPSCSLLYRKPKPEFILNPFVVPGGETHWAITQPHDENRGKNGADRYTPPALKFALSIPASPPASGVPATDGNFLTSVMDFG